MCLRQNKQFLFKENSLPGLPDGFQQEGPAFFGAENSNVNILLINGNYIELCGRKDYTALCRQETSDDWTVPAAI